MLKNIKLLAQEAIGAVSISQKQASLATRFKRGSFFRNVAIVASGNVIAQGILIAASPILTRLYSPSDFGIYAVFLAIVTILSIVFTLQYPLAIVLPKEEQDARGILGIVIRITSVMLIITLTLSAFIKFIGLEPIGSKRLPWIILPVITITAFIEALGVTFNFWNIRTKTYSLISKAVVAAAVATVLLSSGMGVLEAGWAGLVLGALLGRMVNLGIQLFYGNRFQVMRDGLRVSKGKNLRKRLLKEYSDFPKYRLPQNFLNTTSLNVSSILMVAFFGPAIGGLFALAKRVLALPIQLISNSINKVFYQKAVDLFQQGKGLFKASLKGTLGLAAAGFIPFSSIVFFGPDLFAVVFGEDWRTAGVFAAWQALEIYTRLCSVPTTSIIPVVNLLREYMVFEIISITTKVSALIIGMLVGKALTAIILYSISGAVLNIVLLLFTNCRLMKNNNN